MATTDLFSFHIAPDVDVEPPDDLTDEDINISESLNFSDGNSLHDIAEEEEEDDIEVSKVDASPPEIDFLTGGPLQTRVYGLFQMQRNMQQVTTTRNENDMDEDDMESEHDITDMEDAERDDGTDEINRDGTRNVNAGRVVDEADVDAQDYDFITSRDKLPVIFWRSLHVAPPVPCLAGREIAKSRVLIGCLSENSPVHLKSGRTIAKPADEEAQIHRRRGDPVWYRMWLKEHGSPTYEYVDVKSHRIRENIVALGVESDEMIHVEEELKHMYHNELDDRIEDYARRLEIFRIRANYYTNCYPPASANIPGYKTREEAERQLLATIASRKKQLDDKNVYIVEHMKGKDHQTINSRRRELHILREKLATYQFNLEWLRGTDSNLTISPEEVFPPDFGRRVMTMSDHVMERALKRGKTPKEAIAFARATIATGTYKKVQLAGHKLMVMAMVAGWNKPALVQQYPAMILQCKKVWW